jgi:hypothetical protein
MHASTAHHTPDIKVTVFGHTSTTTGQTVLAERLVTESELADGRFAAELDAHAAENGWYVTHLRWRTRADQAEYKDVIKRAAECGIANATGPVKVLLERFVAGEVSEGLLFALGRAAREGGSHPVAACALKAAERDVCRVWWLARLGPLGIDTLLREAETWAAMAIDGMRA